MSGHQRREGGSRGARWLGWWPEDQWARAGEALTDRLGGPARRRVILILAAVLGLNGTAMGAIGAMAGKLEAGLGIGNTELGLLITVSSLVAAVASLPVGVLADRVSRVRILEVGAALWSVAVVVSGLSVDFLMLILTQVVLGAMAATAGPTVASLTGDYFPAAERGRIYGFILTGELVGAGLGIVVAGDIGAAASWRAGFLVVAVPGFVLAWVLRHHLPEPARGGQSLIAEGSERVLSAADARRGEEASSGVGEAARDRGEPTDGPGAGDAAGGRVEPGARQATPSAVADAVAGDVLSTDPATMGLWQAVRYVLGVRTNLLLIVASALGYFFFAGIRTFAVLFFSSRYGIGEAVTSTLVPVVGAGAVIGILIGGRAADRLMHSRRIDARVVLAGVAYLIAVALFLPPLLSAGLAVALPLFFFAAMALGAPNAPLDAARLDVMPSAIWGRAESVRTALRTVLEAAAPLLFGYVSELFGGTSVGLGAGVNPSRAHAAHAAALSAAQADGLDKAFLVMLVPLAASGLLLLRARRHYPTDVASAAESERRWGSPARGRIPTARH